MAGSKRRKAKSPNAGPISLYEDFRKVIHGEKDPTYGLSKAKRRVVLQAVPDIVARLCKNPIYHSLLVAGIKPTSYSRVRGTLLSRCSDNFEIIWTASVLSQHHELLNRFCIERDAFNAAFMRGDYGLANYTLAGIESKFGYSTWSISARLGLTHRQDGLSAQKSILDEITATPAVDFVTAFVSFMMSYSLEDGVTVQDMRRELIEDDSDGLENYRAFLRYHINPFDLNSVRSAAFCIWFESASSLVDQFETFTTMSQLMMARGEYLDELRISYALLSNINDVRIKNARFILLGEGPATFDPVSVAAADAYTVGAYAESRDILSGDLNKRGDFAPLLELAARTHALGATFYAENDNCLTAALVHLLKTHIQMEDDPSETRRQLQALGLAVRKTNSALFIASFLERKLEPSIAEDFSPCEVASYLSAPLVQPQNFRILEKLAPGALRRIDRDQPQISRGATFQLLARTVTPSGNPRDAILELDLPDRRSRFHIAYALYNMGSFQAAAKEIDEIRALHGNEFSPRELSFQLALLRQLDRLDLVLAAFTEAYLSNPEARTLYPLEEMVAWAVRKAEVNNAALDRAILLHAYASNIGTKYDGDLSDAFEDVLDNYGAKLPSEIVDRVSDVSKIRYFLRFIASIDRMEDTVRLDTLDEIESERIKVLQWLIDENPHLRGTYTQEIATITKDQEVARLSAQFERSKIYLHEEGVRRTFSAELKPLFDRYKQGLAEPEIGARAEQIEQRLRRLLKEAESQVGYLLFPSTERDKIYFAMLQRAYDLLVLDPIHGLKTYLSTRILHGVLEGELRSSFATEELLIASDSLDPAAEALQMWGDRISGRTSQERVQIADSLAKFSETILSMVAELKDEKIRIFSKETPNGLFIISLEDDAYQRLKDSLTLNVEYDEFVDRLLATFWESIEDCLRDVRTDILGRFRRQIDSALDALERNLSPYRVGGGISDLSDAIARSRSAFSFSVERIASWFVRSGALPNEPFEIERAVEVATIITNNCFPRKPLAPRVTVCAHSLLDGRVLNPVVDLLTNCLQNAAGHSGFDDQAPSVEIIVEDMESGALKISVSNSISASLDCDAIQSEIEELVQENDEKSRTSVASEGRTGIRKMKRILRHDLQSSEGLTFELTKEPLIRFMFTLPERCKHAVTHH